MIWPFVSATCVPIAPMWNAGRGNPLTRLSDSNWLATGLDELNQSLSRSPAPSSRRAKASSFGSASVLRMPWSISVPSRSLARTNFSMSAVGVGRHVLPTYAAPTFFAYFSKFSGSMRKFRSISSNGCFTHALNRKASFSV